MGSQLPFPRYRDFDPIVPVWCVTPDRGGALHRFFDTSPFSPSGRYLGLTRMRSEDRLPQPGEAAEILVVDLESGAEQVVAETCGWDTQVGAHVQWGASDDRLLYNDVDTATWRPYGVVHDITTDERRQLDGTIYMASPDGTTAASSSLAKTGRTQKGYGVLLPDGTVPANEGAAADDGLYLTDLQSGACRLLVSIAEIVEAAVPRLEPDDFAGGDFYLFHVKWSPDGRRLMTVLRWKERRGERLQHTVITMGADGGDLRVAISNRLWQRGHHPNWCPDSERVLMNLRVDDGAPLRFVSARYDGSDFAVMSDAVPGSGHPTLHPDGRHMLTDVYLHEPLAFGDGTTPIRWIDLEAGSERCLGRVNNDPPYPGPARELRIDPHPAWDTRYRRIAFNGCAGGQRRVYVADLGELL
jgi:hypothetical protein